MPPAALVKIAERIPSLSEDAHWEDGFLRRVAFVGVDAALHRSDFDIADFADDEAARHGLSAVERGKPGIF